MFTIEKGQIETIIKTATAELTTGSVSLIKVDKLDPSHKLMGAEFSVTNELCAVLFEGLKTDKDGKLMVENLKPGNYFVETKAPQHYQLDKTPLAFTIVKGQEMTLTVLAKNDLITGGACLNESRSRLKTIKYWPAHTSNYKTATEKYPHRFSYG